MANTFAASASYRFAGPVGKSCKKIQGVLAIDTTASGGGAVDDLPASMFGLNKIVDCSPIVNDGEDAVFTASPDYTGDSLIVLDNDAASQGIADLPNDNYKLTITGY